MLLYRDVPLGEAGKCRAMSWLRAYVLGVSVQWPLNAPLSLSLLVRFIPLSCRIRQLPENQALCAGAAGGHLHSAVLSSLLP